MVHAGTLTATTPAGDPVTLTPGSAWHPGYRLHHATSRRTILITIDTAAIGVTRHSAAPGRLRSRDRITPSSRPG